MEETYLLTGVAEILFKQYTTGLKYVDRVWPSKPCNFHTRTVTIVWVVLRAQGHSRSHRFREHDQQKLNHLAHAGAIKQEQHLIVLNCPCYSSEGGTNSAVMPLCLKTNV